MKQNGHIASATAAVVALLLSPMAAHAQGEDRRTDVELDGALIAFAVPLVERAAEIAEIWPGFWSATPHFLLLRDQQSALLVANEHPGSDFTAVTGPAVPAPLHGRLFLRREYPPQFGPRSFSLRFVIGPDTVPALEPFGSSAFRRTDFYLHESFHGYQHARFAAVPEDERRARMGEPLVDPVQLGDEFVAAAEQERALLLQALAADAEARVSLLHDYIRTRDARLAHRPDAAAVELRMERTEGSATYVGCRGATTALGAPASAARECVIAELRKALSDMPGVPEADARLMRWRLYGTGAALALLLDDLEVENWKERLQDGAALYGLLREHVVSLASGRARAGSVGP
jgi:hypothetical protein